MFLTYVARKHGLQVFVYLMKVLVIFFCILISEKFEVSFLFMVKFLELL